MKKRKRSPFRRGPLSDEERAYVAANAGRMTAEEIAAKLTRSVNIVEKELANPLPKVGPTPIQRTERTAIRAELRASEKWVRTTKELEPDELMYFEEEYIKLMGQFRGDILASEETQIFDAIKYDILKSRNLLERKRARDEATRLEKQQAEYIASFVDGPAGMNEEQRKMVLAIEMQITKARADEQAHTVDYTKFQERQDALMRSLKSTRDQRVKDFEKSGDTVLSLLKRLQREDVRKEEGRQMELMRLAGEKEYKRLGQRYVYEDGVADRPILSPETVDLEEEE